VYVPYWKRIDAVWGARRLAVAAAEVVDAVGGWVSAERGVGPVEVVAVKPGR
jgi:hypothetical protein